MCLRAALNWAERLKLIDEAPTVEMPRAGRGMKGRPITAEEFERILKKVPATVGPNLASSWIWLLKGLWLSGLRLGEALNLHWTDDRQLCVDFSGRRPMFRIRGTAEKGRRDRILPMAPEFAELLETVPQGKRKGYVFRPKGPEGLSRLSMNWVSKMIVRFGAAGGVKVAERKKAGDDGKPATIVKWASAHDFRRSFGFRWAHRVMPPVLMEMMRHEAIATTMEFYVGRNAEVTADAMWAAYEQNSAAIANKTANNDHPTDSVSLPNDQNDPQIADHF
jgi:integrase